MPKKKISIEVKKKIKKKIVADKTIKKKPSQAIAITGCTFTSKIDVHLDPIVSDVSKALLNLTELFKNQNINITALNIESSTEENEDEN